jgi:hypothetical protein
MFTTKPFWQALAKQDSVPHRIEQQLGELYHAFHQARSAWGGIDSTLDYCDAGAELFALMRDYSIISAVRSRISNAGGYHTDERRALAECFVYMATGRQEDRNSVERAFDYVSAKEFGGYHHSYALAVLCLGDINRGDINTAMDVYSRIPEQWGFRDIVRQRMVEELCLFTGQADLVRRIAGQIRKDLLRVKSLLACYEAFDSEDDLHAARKECSNIPYATGGFSGGVSLERPSADIFVAAAQDKLSELATHNFEGRNAEAIKWSDAIDAAYAEVHATINMDYAERHAYGVKDLSLRTRTIMRLMKVRIIDLAQSDYIRSRVFVPIKEIVKLANLVEQSDMGR